MKTTDRTLQRWRIGKALHWIRPGSHVLDVGCADGTLFRLGRERIRSGVGIDLRDSDVWVGGDAVERRTGAFPDAVREGETYDAIVMLAVIEHVPEQQLHRWASVCAGLLQPGGRVIITVPSPMVDHILHVAMALRLVDGIEVHQHHGFNPRQVPDLFTGAGLTVEHDRRFQLGLNNLFVFQR